MPYLKLNYELGKPAFEEVELPTDSRLWLDACYSLIDCRTIEVAPTVIRSLVLVIDEEGKLWDGWQERINPLATALHGNPYDAIVGVAIVARVDGEDLVPLSAEVIEQLKKSLS